MDSAGSELAQNWPQNIEWGPDLDGPTGYVLTLHSDTEQAMSSKNQIQKSSEVDPVNIGHECPSQSDRT